MDRKHTEFILHMKIADMIFNQHMSGCFKMSKVIIVLEFMNIIAMLLLKKFVGGMPPVMYLYINVVTLILCATVGINNYIHTKAWKKAKEEAEDIYIGLSMLASDDIKEGKGIEWDK